MLSRDSLSCVVPSEKTVEAFKNYKFENCDVPEKYWGDYTHANFFKRYFIPIARREMKKLAAKIGADVIFEKGFFEWSCFFKKDGKCIYVHVGDVRYSICGHWYDNVLYRTAKDEKDYHGGTNNSCSYDKLESCLLELFDWMKPGSTI